MYAMLIIVLTGASLPMEPEISYETEVNEDIESLLVIIDKWSNVYVVTMNIPSIKSGR
jgi:hypothetical protein